MVRPESTRPALVCLILGEEKRRLQISPRLRTILCWYEDDFYKNFHQFSCSFSTPYPTPLEVTRLLSMKSKMVFFAQTVKPSVL